MTASIIDGKAFAAGLRARIAEHAAAFEQASGRKAGLAVVLVGEDPASQVYVRSKGKATLECGMNSFEHKLPADTDEATLLALVEQLNADSAVDGILVQLPLPAHLDEQKVIATINPDKDVDGFHVTNAGRLAVGQPGFVPCTPLGCVMLLKDHLGSLSGLDAVVIGRSNIVGKPISIMLSNDFDIGNATVTLTHIETPRKLLLEETRRADIVIVAVGIPGFVTADMVKDGVTLIDVGINRLDNGKIVGDVDFPTVAPKCGWITPVPGGVGRMTVAALMINTLMAYQNNFELA